MNNETQKLHLAFHGKIIDHLGIQMYQSPTAAIAEIVSNAWDADAEHVNIDFDFQSSDKTNWSITIRDDGHGMSFEDCQHRFLNVGYNRREKKGPSEKSRNKQRPVMGRKGIGKFAGFGIARYITVETVCENNLELTKFELDLNTIRQGDSYVSTQPLEISVLDHKREQTEISKGTKIILHDLKISRQIPEDQFAKSLARKFLINSTADSFEIQLNGKELPNGTDLSNIELSFPRDFSEADIKSRNIDISPEGWATEKLPNGKTVQWRIQFCKDLINNEEISGVTVFAHKKLAQRPFMFNMTGGTASQAGPEYITGCVVADWVDEFGEDIISTERQRLNWEHPELKEFQIWGENLLRRLLSIWKSKRTEKKMKELEGKVSKFSDRLQTLGLEGPIVKKALEKIASIEKINLEQFIELGDAVLLAWEGGRLKGLIDKISRTDEMNETDLVQILVEANVITALHTAETVQAKLLAIQGLKERVEKKELENAVRDFIAKNPWLISPDWETYIKEKRLDTILQHAARDILDSDDEFKGRVDLVLSSGDHLLLLEFMRPGLTLDRDHLNRFTQYTDYIQDRINSETALGFRRITGYLVADNIANKTGMNTTLNNMSQNHRFALSWDTLIKQAEHWWKDFLINVKARVPDDPRIQAIKNSR